MKPIPLLATALAALLFAGGTAPAAAPAQKSSIVRPAPAIPLQGGKTVRSLRGQPVVVVVAPSPRDRLFRKQVKRWEADYAELAARSAVFVAVFTQGDGAELRSSIPFAVAQDGPAVAAALGLADSRFGVAVIGQDGNVDLLTRKLAPSYKVRDTILNNYALQSAERR